MSKKMDLKKSLVGISHAFTVIWIFTVLKPIVAQSSPGLSYTTMEESSAGTLVGDVKKDSDLSSKHSPAILEQLRFKFLTEPTLDFVIEDTSGIIRTGSKIDRDQVCPGERTCIVNLDVAVQPVQYFEIVKVKVEIIDINDNSPAFPQSQLTYQILESTLPGRSFTIQTADDPDSPVFGVKRYQISSEAKEFELGVIEKQDGTPSVKLALMEELDRESKDIYYFSITAFDGGVPEKTGNVEIQIVVQDSNDNSPIFEVNTYEATVLENAPVDFTILTVKASDKDIGQNGFVVYDFSPQTKAAFGKVFGIRNTTGEIYVRDALNYETEKDHVLTVVATDLGADAIPAEATVTVTIVDVNDHPPEITVNSLSAAGTDEVEVSENVKIGTFVAHITVVDKDSGKNGEFNCTLNDKDFHLEELFATEYKVVTSTRLDREVRDKYNLVIVCKDGGSEPLSSLKHLTVLVGDRNDNTPVFNQPEYEGQIEENNFMNEFILQVNATDQDIGRNAELQYTLHTDAGDQFQIDSRTGIITAKTVFDHEQTPEIRFRVIASDRGSPVKYESCFVTVTITDTNDERPEFDQKAYSFGIFENEAPGSEVGIVTATDADKAPFDKFSFSLVQTGSNFVIDDQTGKISTRKVLDRETESVHYITVVATDNGVPPMSSTASVSIYVADKNDNAPIFRFPTRYENVVYISNRVPMGHNITQVLAEDKDLGNNGQITYSLQGDEGNGFAVEPYTGIITVNSELTGFEHAIFEFYVVATDEGFPTKSSAATLQVVVNNTIAFTMTHSQNRTLGGPNFIIVIVLGCFMGLAMVVLITAIAAICVRDVRRKQHHKYNCPRAEQLKMLQANGGKRNSTDTNCSREGTNDLNRGFADGHPKKDFCININDSAMERTGTSWPSTIDHQTLEHPQAHSSTLGNQTFSPTAGSSAVQCEYPLINPETNKPWTLTRKELEVHQLLQMLKRESDSESEQGSNTDSGRGPSEEGDGHFKHRDKVPKELSPEAQVVPSLSCSQSTQQSFGNSQTALLGQKQHYPMQTFKPDNKPPMGYNKLDSSSGSGSSQNMTQSTLMDSTLDAEQLNADGSYTGYLKQSNPKPASQPTTLRSPSRRSQLPPLPPKRDPKHSPFKTPRNYGTQPHGNVPTDSTLNATENGLQYSVADMSDILNTRTPSHFQNQTNQDTADETSSTTSGSYVVDPQELCEEIDNLFFKDVVV